jgi:glycosyltransferase involved in cell wall biosynthesis
MESDLLLIVAAVSSFLYLIMVLYFLLNWLKLKKVEATSVVKEVSVTIVVPVRNEEKGIKACVESLFNQTYPKHLFEVIVVDDYSTDDTRKIVRELNIPALRLFDLQQYLGARGEKKPNKKEAISIGIKNAQGDLIITTDGDCVRSENWLQTMVSFFVSHNYKLVTAPVLIKPAYTPLQLLQQADVMALMGITGATIYAHKPTMCSGANLMYAKETFHALEGFKGNNDVPSGDDIFLMQKVLEKYPNGIGFVKNYDAAVFTQPEKGIFSFLGQRIRWVGKSVGYANWWVKLMLYFTYIFNVLVIGVLSYSLFDFYRTNDIIRLLPGAVAFFTKLIADLLFCIPVFYFFKRLWLLLIFPFIEIQHILYIIFIGILGLSGRYRWRGRRVS